VGVSLPTGSSGDITSMMVPPLDTSSPSFVCSSGPLQGLDPTPIQPGCREPEEGESSLSDILGSLIPYLKYSDPPILLPSYFGKALIILVNLSREVNVTPLAEDTNLKDYSWSRGRGIEYSPIKTRSLRKNLQSDLCLPLVEETTTSDRGALRAVKALARSKP